MRLAITTHINEHDIRDSVLASDHDTIAEFVLALDLAVADAGFTEALVKKLMASLRGDTGDKEWEELIGELRSLS